MEEDRPLIGWWEVARFGHEGLGDCGTGGGGRSGSPISLVGVRKVLHSASGLFFCKRTFSLSPSPCPLLGSGLYCIVIQYFFSKKDFQLVPLPLSLVGVRKLMRSTSGLLVQGEFQFEPSPPPFFVSGPEKYCNSTGRLPGGVQTGVLLQMC